MKNIAVKLNLTIKQAMKKMGQSGEKCLVIIDKKNTVLGTLSDGDIRRAILMGTDISNPINKIYHTKPTVLVKGKYRFEEAKKLFAKNMFDLIPVVDEQGGLVDILFWKKVSAGAGDQQKNKIAVPVVIMAGGRGTRLDPFTKILPKPLVPIHEKPVIEHIIERFTYVGVKEFILTINYKSRIMKAYFEELKPDFSVEFVEEQEPLGTAGSLIFLKNKFDKAFFVTNCDIIIEADYPDILKFHLENSFDITLVASMKKFIIPYGICELNDEGHLKKINEKPDLDLLVNTGLYVINPDELHLIPGKKVYHITHLIEDIKKSGKSVGVYPIDEDAWVDVGQWSEYDKAEKNLKNFF